MNNENTTMLFKIKKKIRRATLPLKRIFLTPAKVKALIGHENQQLHAIGLALQQVLKSEFAPAENQWITRIETLRHEVSQSQEPISVIDYGAGAPTDTRSQEEMARGILQQYTMGSVCLSASKKGVWSQLLFYLTRHLKPHKSLELGTSLGFSAAYQAAALELNGDGELVTLEGAPNLAKQAECHWKKLGLSCVRVVSGRFVDTLIPLLDSFQPIDHVFIDGHHNREATLNYFEMIYPYTRPGSVLIFDDIAWTPGMQDAWKTICQDKRISFAIDLDRIGICLVKCPTAEKYLDRVPFFA